MLDDISLVASIASLILAIVAIWLSYIFYKMSDIASKEITKASQEIKTSVEKLELVFDKLYNDAFSVMRDTMTDMRKHILKPSEEALLSIEKEVDQKTDAKLDEIRQGVQEKMSTLLQEQVHSEEANMLEEHLSHLIDMAINDTREVEANVQKETLQQHLQRQLQSSHAYGVKPSFMQIKRFFPDIAPNQLANSLIKLQEQDIIESDLPIENLLSPHVTEEFERKIRFTLRPVTVI